MKKGIVVGLILSVGLSIGLTAGVNAVINDRIDQPNNLAGLALSPMTSGRLDLKPGESYDGRFRVRMTGHETQDVVAEITPYSSGAQDDYSSSDFKSETRYTKVLGWMSVTLEEDDTCKADRHETGKVYFQLDPQEECYLNYHIAVPSDAYGGSQRAAILVRTINETMPENGGTGINNQYQVGYMMTANIDGPDAKAEGRVVETKVPGLLFMPPVKSSILVENTGSLDFEAEYKVTVKNYFGSKEVYSKEDKALVMAETRRLVSNKWNDTPRFGLFKVTVETTVLGETSTLNKTVLVIPLALIIAILVVLALLGLWAYTKVTKQKGPKSKK